jgi:hypothetical protein
MVAGEEVPLSHSLQEKESSIDHVVAPEERIIPLMIRSAS